MLASLRKKHTTSLTWLILLSMFTWKMRDVVDRNLYGVLTVISGRAHLTVPFTRNAILDAGGWKRERPNSPRKKWKMDAGTVGGSLFLVEKHGASFTSLIRRSGSFNNTLTWRSSSRFDRPSFGRPLPTKTSRMVTRRKHSTRTQNSRPAPLSTRNLVTHRTTSALNRMLPAPLDRNWLSLLLGRTLDGQSLLVSTQQAPLPRTLTTGLTVGRTWSRPRIATPNTSSKMV